VNPPCSDFTDALLRSVSRSLSLCNLTYLSRQTIDPALAAEQHHAYANALSSAGLRVHLLPEQPSQPDSVFIEDNAALLDELVIVARSACTTRAAEKETLLPTLEQLRPIHLIQPPGTLDGGDVLAIGKTLFAGLSSRTNESGIHQLESFVQPFGYRVVRAKVSGCLHLKTGVTCVAPNVLLVNPLWFDREAFPGFEVMMVPPEEPWAANTLLVNGKLLLTARAPRTLAMLRARDYDVVPLDISELQKAEAGLTCLSLLYRER